METEEPATPTAPGPTSSVDQAKQDALREYRRILLQHKEADARVRKRYDFQSGCISGYSIAIACIMFSFYRISNFVCTNLHCVSVLFRYVLCDKS